MIPILLQDCLIKILKDEFIDFNLKNANGELTNINIYPQYLPSKKGSNDLNHFPYIVVIIEDGEDETEGLNTCNVLLMAGVFDENKNYQGYRDVINVLQKIYTLLAKNPIIDNKFDLKSSIKWKLNDEDSYPYFFGGIYTAYSVGKIMPLVNGI